MKRKIGDEVGAPKAQLSRKGKEKPTMPKRQVKADRYKQMETLLDECETRFFTIFHTSHDVIGILRLSDDTFLHVNEAFCSIFEVSHEHVIGKHVNELNRLVNFQERDEFQRAILEKGCGSNLEIQYKTASGKKGYMLLSGRVTKMAGEDCLLFFGENITERKHHEYNRSLIEASLDPLVTIGPDGTITDVNTATEWVTGYSRAELIGTDFFDYFTKPDQARIGYQQFFSEGTVRDYPLEIRHRDGHIFSVLYNASLYRDASGKVIGVFAAARDITERKQAEEKLEETNRQLEEQLRQIRILKDYLSEQATHDSLTSLYNRRYFHEAVTREIAHAKRDNYPISMMMIDVDHFKEINDSYGHDFGDEVLKSLAALFYTNIREGDIACRYGGDEFIIVMPKAGTKDAERRAEMIRESVAARPVRYGGMEFTPQFSVGIATYPQHGGDGDEVVHAADGALYQSKQGGRNRVSVWGSVPPSI